MTGPWPPPRGDGDQNTAYVELGRLEHERRVSASLFANFLEHMSYAITGGVSAEMLSNCTFSRRHWLSTPQLWELRRNAQALETFFLTGDRALFESQWTRSPEASGFGTAVFDDETADGIPLPWSRVGGRPALPDVGRLGDAVRLRATGSSVGGDRVDLDSGPGGVRQAVFLPDGASRTIQIEMGLRATARGRSRLQAGLRRRYDGPGRTAGDIIAMGELEVEGGEWTTLGLVVDVPIGEVAPLEPVDFFLRWLGTEGDLLVDRASAMPSDHVDRFDPRIVRLMSKAGIAELRWPGGNFASYYHWRDGVGPSERRPTVENRAWGGLDTNSIGTDEYLCLCRATGSEPHITVNMGTATAEEAADWVEYCNGPAESPMGALRARNGHPEPYGVRIWELGNETYGEWQGGHIGSVENARRTRQFADAMRRVSPVPLHLIATGNMWDFIEPGPKYGYVTADGQWHAELARHAIHEIDAVSLHSTPINDKYFEDASEAEANLAMFGHLHSLETRFMPLLFRTLDAARGETEDPLTVAFTEWGALGFDYDRIHIENYGGAIWAAAFLNMAIRHCDRISVTSPNGLTHGGGIKKVAGAIYVDPQFEVIGRYRHFAGGIGLSADVTGPGFEVVHPADVGHTEPCVPYVDAAAVESSDGVLLLALVNRNFESAIRTTVDPTRLGRLKGAKVTTATSSAGARARCDVSRQRGVDWETRGLACHGDCLDLELPALSISILELTLAADPLATSRSRAGHQTALELSGSREAAASAAHPTTGA